MVKELQTSAREAIVLLRAMIGEVCLNVEEEESAICSLFNSLQVVSGFLLCGSTHTFKMNNTVTQLNSG